MSTQFLVSTTGTLNPVSLDDLGIQVDHPTTDRDFLLEFGSDELANSGDLQSAITAGHLTATDENSDPITTVGTAVHIHANKDQLDLITDGDHDVRADNPHSTSIANIGSGTLSNLNSALSDATLIDTTDSRLSDARTPLAHASSHVTGGLDKIRDATAAQDGLMTLAYASKLDGIAAGADLTPQASESVAGKIEIATQAETNTGTDDLRAVTPLKLSTYISSLGLDADLACVQVRDTVGIANIPLTWTDLSFNTTDVENNSAIIEHDDTNRDRIQIKESGAYLLAYSFAGDDENQVRVRINDSTVIDGSLQESGDPADSNNVLTVNTKVFLSVLASGQFVTVQIQAATSDELLSVGGTFVVIRLRGAKGDTGDTGSGSSIIIKEEGTTVTGGPHSSVNFIGPCVTASNVGGGQANVTVSCSLVKTAFAEVSADTTTTATIASPATLLTLSITPASASNFFCVHFDASGDLSSTNDGEISFQLFYGLTGSETRRRSTFIFHDNSAKESGSCALTWRGQALGTGEHTIQIRWGRTTDTARIRPVTDPQYDHASLLVQEVTV